MQSTTLSKPQASNATKEVYIHIYMTLLDTKILHFPKLLQPNINKKYFLQPATSVRYNYFPHHMKKVRSNTKI